MDTAYEMRKSLFEKLQSLSYSYFDVTPAGWLLSRLTSDVSRLSEILSWSLMDLFWGISVMLGSVIVMFTVNVKLAIMVLVIVPVLAFITRYFNLKILKNYRDVRKINSKIILLCKDSDKDSLFIKESCILAITSSPTPLAYNHSSKSSGYILKVWMLPIGIEFVSERATPSNEPLAIYV